MTNFTVLRALGATPGQVAGVLLCEQCINYAVAIVLGIILGGIFAVLVVPQLVFTSVPQSGITSDMSSAAFYAEQSAPPIQIIIPPSLGIVLGVLLVICILTLGLMVYIISRSTISQVLRLNED